MEPQTHYFPLGPAVRHISGNSYSWVHPMTGEHLGYVKAEPITYYPTLEQQRQQLRV